MMACGSFARDVLNRNLRRCSCVSGEKEYKRDSEACIEISSSLATASFFFAEERKCGAESTSPYWTEDAREKEKRPAFDNQERRGETNHNILYIEDRKENRKKMDG